MGQDQSVQPTQQSQPIDLSAGIVPASSQNPQNTNTPNNTQSQPIDLSAGLIQTPPQQNQGQQKQASDISNHGLLARAWDWANSPVADKLLPKDMKTADLLKAAAFEKLYNSPYIPGVNDFDTVAKVHEGQPIRSFIKTLVSGSAKDAANMAAGLTSPGQLALMATGAGEAGLLGKGVATVAKPTAALAGTGLVAAGASQTYDAVKKAIAEGLTPKSAAQAAKSAVTGSPLQALTELNVSPETMQQGLSGAALAAGGTAGAAKGVQGAGELAASKLRPTTETVGNTEVPVRNPGLIAKTAQKMVSPETLENFAKEKTGPAVAKGIGEVAKSAAGTEGEVAPTETDRLGIRGVADETKARSQATFQKLDEVSGNMLSEAQQMADDASGDFTSKGRKEYRQAMDLQDAIFDNYKGHSELQGMDLDQAKADWRKQVALRDISKKLSSATESSETGTQDYQFKQGKQLAEAVDSLVKNDKDVLQRAGMTDDHIDQLQKFGRIVRDQANTPRFANYWGGIAKSVAGMLGFTEGGGFGGALGAMAGESLAEHAGGWIADKMLGKVLTTPAALDTFNSEFGKVPPAKMAEDLKTQIAKTDPTWAEKTATALANLWHDESGQLSIPGIAGTSEGAALDTRLFQQAKAENPTGSVSDWAKRAQELKTEPQSTYEYDPMGQFADAKGDFGNVQHKVTTMAKGQKIGELAAQDTAPGTVTVRSNQIYDPDYRGQGFGKAQLMRLFKSASENGAKTVNSDISTTGAAQNVWNSLEKRFPDAVTKKVYADGRPQWTVNLKALKDRLDFEGTDYTNTERRATRRQPMNATELDAAMKLRQPINTPFSDTAGAMDTINRDKAMPAYPGQEQPEQALATRNEIRQSSKPNMTVKQTFKPSPTEIYIGYDADQPFIDKEAKGGAHTEFARKLFPDKNIVDARMVKQTLGAQNRGGRGIFIEFKTPQDAESALNEINLVKEKQPLGLTAGQK